MENEAKNEEIGNIIKEAVEELVKKMDINSEVAVEETTQEGQKSLVCNIKTEESNYLIGQYGVNLQALQHIARILIRKKTQDKTNFILDVNSYRQEKNESISIMAKNMAEKAIQEGRAVVLRPMSAYERRLIHMELSGNDEVKTESIGEGEDRRIVIKPAKTE